MNSSLAFAPNRRASLIALAGFLSSCGGGGDSGSSPDSGVGTGSASSSSGYPHASEPIGTVRQIYDGVLTPELAITTYRNADRLFPTRTIEPGSAAYPLPAAATSFDAASFRIAYVAQRQYVTLDTYLDTNRVAALLILKNGQIAYELYRYGNTRQTRWVSFSMAKSVTSTLVGAAVKDGYIASIYDQVVKYVPQLIGSAYDGATVRDLLMMASGVKWSEGYKDSTSDFRHVLETRIGQVPGAALAFMRTLPRAAPPGAVFNYDSGESQILGQIVINAVGKPLAQYLSEKIWSRFGMEAEANWWLESPDGFEVGSSGLSATLRDFGRFGQFVMGDGFIGADQIVPSGWFAEAGSPKTLSFAGLVYYGYQWWPTQGATASDGAFYANGLMGQRIYVNRKERVVIVTWGAQTDPNGAGTLPVESFFDSVVAALKTN
jgi:CubicO group peptidase (beta-lactamase class C family)